MIEVSDETEIEEIQETWSPRLFERQRDVLMNETHILLVSGPRFSGKSIALSHKTIMKAWDIYEANIGIVVSSYKVATGGGSWHDIVKAAREWANAAVTSEYGHTFEITTVDPETGKPGSKLDKDSRTPYMKVRNKFGTESTIRLISIDNENEIEEKTKSGKFQFIWVVELSNFKSRKVLTQYENLLRPDEYNHIDPESKTYLPYEKCQIVADTNPAEDGKKNWIYRWFWLKDKDVVPDEYRQSVENFSKKMAYEEIFIKDNTYLPKDKYDDLVGMYAGDPELFQRFVLGEWPDGSLGKAYMFGDVLTEALMIDGEIEIDELTETLIGGWDLGVRNKAFTLLERKITEGRTVWCVLAEVVYIASEVSISEFTREVMSIMIELTEFYKKKRANFRGFKFEHWSDSSSWNQSISDDVGTEAVEVYNASNRQIELRPVDKPAKSVECGCQIIRKLMREERFFIGNNTPQLKKSLQNIKRSSKAGKTLDVGDPLKHACDAIRYPIFAFEVDEMMNSPVQAKIKNMRTMSIPLI